MNKLVLILIVFSSIGVFGQNAEGKITDKLQITMQSTSTDEEILTWVFFTDKGENLENYFSNPTSVVSGKSLKRRAKVLDKNSLISETDLPVNENYINLIQQSGFKVKQKSRWFNGVSGYVTKQMINHISNYSFIRELDVVRKFKNSYEEDEFDEQKSGDNQNEMLSKPDQYLYNYGPSQTQLDLISVPQVHDLGYTGEGVTICMMDAGFDRWTTHQVFSSMNVIATWDFVNDDPDVENGSDLGNGSHGTSTLSLIGGFYEGQLIGPAFGAEYILAKTENTESETPIEEDNWIAAMEWADSIGVEITSTSLGYLDFDPPFPSYTWEDMDGNTALITIGADIAAGLGIFVVNSAGNSGFNSMHNTLGAPADGDSVVAIGSVTSSGTRSSFSSVGPTVDGRIKPDLMAQGSSNQVACNWSNSCYSQFGSGTSWACPMVAGAAALILEADPSLTPMQLLDLLRSTSSQSSNPDNLMGWGIIDTYAAIQSLVTSTDNNNVVEDYYILRNYPNPFNPSTTVQFAVPKKSIIKLTLHNALGEEIRVLFDGEVNPGLQEFKLDAGNYASGVYFIRMIAEDKIHSLKVALMK
jgi:serine protease AprX